VIHNRNLVAGRGIVSKPTAGSAERDHGARFELDGHSLIAVRRSSCGRKNADGELGFAPSADAVGRITCSGKQYLVYDAQQTPAARWGAPSPIAEILTRRELQVALLIGDGKCDKEIARHLGISGYTVREHIRRIFAKLNIGRRSAIVACVLR
jgi:DNA-binding CsgD family transcriptional regulator